MLDMPDFDEPYLKNQLVLNERIGEHFTLKVAECDVDYGSGGAHYGQKGIWEGNIIDVDFASLYPNIMVNFNLGSRKIKNPDKIRELMEQRLAFKANKDPRANSLKIVINSIFGVSGDQYSEIYDPEACYSVCACGQLIITHLARAVKPFCKILNVNTDGLFCLVHDEEGFIKAACKVSEEVMIGVEFDYYKKLIQRDVNNYIAIAKDGSYHSKGAIWKPHNELDNNCPIVQKALVNYVLKGSYLTFIEDDTDLSDFMFIVRKGSKYRALYHGFKSPETILGDTNRVFASNQRTGTIYKETMNGKLVKYPDLPENVFIDNGDVRGKKTPYDLDRSYYINKVEKILEEWGLIAKPAKNLTLADFW